MLSLLVPLLLIQGPGTTATVNDPLSHGTVGDALLSLDEAIRLGNGTLLPTALSPGEQAQLAGTGLIATIAIDAMITPTITVQQPLTDMTGPSGVHQHVEVHGMTMLGMPLPVLQGGSVARVFTLRTINASLHDLRLVGGQVAVDARMPQPAAPVAHMAEIMGCEFSGQTVAAVHVHGTGTDESMLMLEECRLQNMALGFLLDDQTAGGMVMIEAERVEFDGVTLGCRVVENGAGGQMSMFMLFRSSFVNGTTLAEQRRSPTSQQQFMFRLVHSHIDCTGNVLDIEGTAAGLTMVHHHHSDFVAGPGQKAFWVWPRTAQFDIHGSEMRFHGDVVITGNLASPRIWQQNNTYENGTVTIDVDGALPNLLWNHYDGCTIDVPATARSPVVVRSSQLVTTDVNGASFLAPVTLQGCWRSGGNVTGFATETNAAPSRFLGTTTVDPAEPQVGTSIQLSTDLPYGIALVWDIAPSFARPTTTLEPVRFYGDPTAVIVLPAIVLFQSTMTVPIPNIAALAGLEFYAQGISLPLLGQPWAPIYHLPRGQLLLLQP